ncbi:MAG: DUF2974 domain-containing protein [Pyrinomonadaceae bacterium]|nr:DUF2974 domain-containing protein [Pyrinomonadaceae bacterium]
MSLIDSIRNAPSNIADFGNDVVDNVGNVGSQVVNKAREFGGDVVDNAQEIGENIADSYQAAENVAVNTLKFQGDVVRFGLEKTLDAGKTVATGAVNGLKTAGEIVARTFNSVTHPGDPNPPSAQGLEFSETKSASALAYKANAGEVYKFPNGEEWKVVDVSSDPKTGFRAIALQPANDASDKRTIVAYAGTDPKSGRDWGNDIVQGIGLLPKQYKQAADFADKWKSQAGNNVILTGHSLGGGLSSYASIKTGLRATALNSAPLALSNLGGNPLSSSVRNNKNITQYYVPGEILTNIDKANPLDVRPGDKIAVQGKYSVLNPLAAILNHSNGGIAPNIPDAVLVR